MYRNVAFTKKLVMNSRKKILMIPGYDVYPVYFGGAYGQTTYLTLQQEQHDITLIISPDNIKPEKLAAFKAEYPLVNVITTLDYNKQKKGRKKYFGLWGKEKKVHTPAGYFDGVEKNINLLFKCRQDVADLLPYLFEKQHFDIVQIEHIVNLGLVVLIPASIKKVYIHPEIFYTRIKQELLSQQYTAAYVEYLSECVRTLELGLLNQYDSVITVTEQDKILLQESGLNKKIYTSTSPIQKKDIKYLYEPSTEPLFLFMGSESHYPNLHGLEWFFTEVYPIILEKNIPFKMLITGWWSKSFKKKYSMAGCTFVGFIDDLNTIMYNTVLINPVTMGSGLRMKVVVSLARGVPVISTTYGANGIIGLINNTNIILANSANGFANAIKEIYDDVGMRSLISKHGFELVNEHYNQEKTVAIRNVQYDEILAIKG